MNLGDESTRDLLYVNNSLFYLDLCRFQQPQELPMLLHIINDLESLGFNNENAEFIIPAIRTIDDEKPIIANKENLFKKIEDFKNNVIQACENENVGDKEDWFSVLLNDEAMMIKCNLDNFNGISEKLLEFSGDRSISLSFSYLPYGFVIMIF